MTRNILFIAIGAVAAAAVIAGYLYYQDRQSGVDIKIDENGVTINGN